MNQPHFERDTAATLAHEGVYAHDPADPGGETCYGVSRRYYPRWEIWQMVDAVKRRLPAGATAGEIRQAIAQHPEIEESALRLYRAVFWDPHRMDELGDGRIAAELFDQVVNLPAAEAVKHLQRALNALNRQGALYPDLDEDGVVGNKTIMALQKYLVTDGPRYGHDTAVHRLLVLLNGQQVVYYMSKMRASPAKESFARGWIDRATFAKR